MAKQTTADEFSLDHVKEDNKKLKAFENIRESSNDKLDCGFYAVLVFQNKEQQKKFLNEMKENGVSIYRDVYLDGQEVANNVVGMNLPEFEGKPLEDRLNKKRKERAELFAEAYSKL
jgi:hypothetical protein